MKILVVAESIDLDSGSGGKVNRALILNLIQCGFRVKVYHYTRKEISLKGAATIAIKENRSSELFLLSRMERYIRNIFGISLNHRIEKRVGFSFTLKNDRNSIISALRKEKDFEPDWVLTLSQGGSFRPHHALLRLPKWHSRWIAYIHDPYPMHWYPKPYTWQEQGYKAKQRFMQEIADNCKYAAFPSKLLKEWMGTHYTSYFEKGIVIPHQLNKDTEEGKSSPIKINAAEFTILHAGNLLQARNPKGLIEGFKLFLNKNPKAPVKFLHVGPAEHYQTYLEKEAAENPQISAYCENLPFHQVLKLQENVSVNVIIEAKAGFSPFLPGKFPHCIATEKPILLLGPLKSEAKRLLGDTYPYWAEIDDTEQIEILIGELYQRWKAGLEKWNYKEVIQYLSADNLKVIIENLNKL
ncbi:UDP-glycosyltransferase [Antarcticibacterium sp. 1MA-6-2]|uniref:UDP-glycosyltransferase n=1 Tax=Antarcticibacterium sp. 1MA-6-2 TaxID=2908210 RepID=UPI001F3DC925|nr:UDP-glycosyltransferase [Antarcticibacterium sp. 1MA-6-2]UJH92510.1 UDP-glycosyltransferase [Antarcticibacterium sp. 1MA-6-2]